MPTTSVSGLIFDSSSAEFCAFSDEMRSSLCETMWLSEKRVSTAGLKICTRCLAISARRSRRISSSLLPLNMLPTTTSIQPVEGVRTTSISGL